MSTPSSSESPDILTLPDRESWLQFRRSHIGGSDAAVLLGVNPRKSPFQLWAEKTGQLDDVVEETEQMFWGRRLEGVVADVYAERTGRSVIDPGPYTVRIHGRRRFIAVTLDREIIDPKRPGPGAYEGKTTNVFLAEPWREGAPILPQVQLQHGLLVTGWEWGSIAALIGGQELQSVDVERNEDFVELLEDRCCWFWDLVERRVPPPIDDSPATLQTIKRLHPNDSGQEIALPAEAVEWDRELQRIKATIKDLDLRQNLIESCLRAAIAGATVGQLPDGSGYYSLKTITNRGYTKTVEPYTYRSLLRHEPKQAPKKRKNNKE